MSDMIGRSAEHDLVLGAAAGYHFGDVAPFLVSLDRSGFRGCCVFFVSATTRELARMAALPRNYRLRLLLMPGPEHSEAASCPGVGALLEQAAFPQGGTKPLPADLPCNALRHFLSLALLEREAAEHDRVLLTDVRDVVFQRDPFSFAWPGGLNAVLEHRAALLGQCPHNSRWVRNHFGPEALSSLALKPVSCSGTSLGSAEAVRDYLRRLTDLLLPFAPARLMAGYDQAAHNLLVHGARLPALTLHDNAGPVLTLASRPGDPEVDAEGDVLNDAGRPAHIVHQYDRHPALFTHLRARFAPPRPHCRGASA